MTNEYTDTALNLEILAEEAGEIIEALSRVIRMKSKITRFGLTDHHPKNRISNKEALEEEIGHFLAMVEILTKQGALSKRHIKINSKKKKKTLGLYYQPMGSAPIITLGCCCCGTKTKGRQWKNRDDGVGVCPKCANWHVEKGFSAESLQKMFGDKGYHYNVQETK